MLNILRFRVSSTGKILKHKGRLQVWGLFLLILKKTTWKDISEWSPILIGKNKNSCYVTVNS